MPANSVTELQQRLFKRMGVDSSLPIQHKGNKTRGHHGSSQSIARKEGRRLQRTQKKSQRYSKQPSKALAGGKYAHIAPPTSSNSSIARTNSLSKGPRAEQSDDLLTDADMDSGSEGTFEGLEDWEHSSDASSGGKNQDPPDGGVLSRQLREKLAQDDAEIKEFERKLGIRQGRRSLPTAFKVDGLDELIPEVAEDDASSEDEIKKRKFAYDSWLSSKRRRAEQEPGVGISSGLVRQRYDAIQEHAAEVESDSNSSDIHEREDHSDDEGRNTDTLHRRESRGHAAIVMDDANYADDGADSEHEAPRSLKPAQRENPYVAPTAGTVISKYIPPSLRHEGIDPGKQLQPQLQRKIRGLVNRLTDANLKSIVQSVDEIYQWNARGEVTEIITDAILAQMRRQENLPDQFFVLVGGFVAAIYKITGSSFGSHIVRQTVAEFSKYYRQASEYDSNRPALPKEPSNFLSFLTQLYVFEVISCGIIFDYLERLLEDLSELNVELILRVCRMAGNLLRRDDSQALKHVSHVLSSAIKKVGYTNVSVRTKFMVETIQDLKNSKTKAKGMDSSIVSEHVVRMRKRLGELKSQSRRLEGLTPMGIGLKDIESVDKNGEWWLVGASVLKYRDAEGGAGKASKAVASDHEAMVVDGDQEDLDFVLPDYPNKARAQGFNTTTQIAIFTAIMSGLDYEHGYRQFAGLKLKRDEQLEISRVLVQCVGSEPFYNEYYALVASQACADSRVRFAFQDRLWKIFRNLGESMFGEGAEVDETTEGEKLKNERRLGNIAQFYASLMADGVISISVLKALDLPELNEWTSLLVESLLLTLLRECRKKKINEDKKVERIFGPAKQLPALAANLHWFLRKKVGKSSRVGDKERKAMQRVREKAQETLLGSNDDEQC